MNAAPGGGLRAAGGLWGPPARALCETLGRRFPQRHRPTWLSPGADQPTPVLIRLLVAGWLTFRVAAPRLSPATTWGPSPANLVVANRPRGLTRDSWYSFDMEELEGQEVAVGRAGIMLHGGGSACGWPGAWAAQQPLYPTLGCVRLHNADLRDKVLPLYRQGTVYVGVFQEKK